MIYYSEPYSHIKDKVKVVLDLSNYATKKELNDASGVEASSLAAKRDFVKLKNQISINASSGLNNLKTKADDLDVNKLQNISVDLNKLHALVSKKVVKNIKFNKLDTKVNNLENKNPDATTLITINQCSTDKQQLEKKIGVAQ